MEAEGQGGTAGTVTYEAADSQPVLTVAFEIPGGTTRKTAGKTRFRAVSNNDHVAVGYDERWTCMNDHGAGSDNPCVRCSVRLYLELRTSLKR